MSSPASELGVYKVIRDGPLTTLHVRCFTGPVSTGDQFRRAIPSTRWERMEASMPVQLTVHRLVAYGKELQSIETGLTAAVTVSGEIPTGMSEGWILTSE